MDVTRLLAPIAAALLIAAGPARAQRVSVPTYGATPLGPSVLLSNENGDNAYSGVVRVESRATCSGVFIVPSAGSAVPADASAYVLTNGHCPAFPSTNDVLLDRASPGRARVVFEYFADTTSRQYAVPIRRVSYATMKGRDLAVLELEARHRDLVSRGFMPWRVSAKVPSPTEAVVVVGAPLRANPAEAFLRLASCSLEGRARTVFEFSWFWYDADRLRCRDIAPGSSGSPVISRETAQVVGLVNTTTAGTSPYTACSLDHPCEPEGQDDVGLVDTAYSTNVQGLGQCFDHAGRFDVSLSGCPLDPGRQAAVSPGRLGYQNPTLDSLFVPIQPRRRWNVTVGGTLPYYRYKVVLASAGDCRDPRGYGAARSVAQSPLIDDPLPTRDGWRLLCIVSGDTPGWSDGWQAFGHATVVPTRIDTVPPQLPAQVVIEESDLGWRLIFGSVDPEVSSHTLKWGPPGTSRCDDASGYRLALVPFYFLPKSGRPYTLCVIPGDAAGNPGATLDVLLP